MVEEENVVEKDVPREKKAKLGKEGLNDVLVKLRRPITQAKVKATLTGGRGFLILDSFIHSLFSMPRCT